MHSTPYLSVVAVSRNDDHGGDPLIRTQIFINCFAWQCEKFKLPGEIVLVDWNPVPDRPGLASVLQLPKKLKYCTARVITVPSELHETLKYSENLPLFQMIAKNVGIRRAKGEFILATNIDILFSDELISFIAKRKLDPDRQYRVDRYDIDPKLEKDVDLDTALSKAWGSLIRTNLRANLPKFFEHLYGGDPYCRDCAPTAASWPKENEYKLEVVQDHGVWQALNRRDCPFEHLHTNACGDFTLISRKGWDAIRGYPDFEAYSFNIDSAGVIMAHYAGFLEVHLLPPLVCFHIEHSVGSGYTPENADKLFARLSKNRILNPDWIVLLPWFQEMRAKQVALEFNRDNWGLIDYDLPEVPLGTPHSERTGPRKLYRVTGSVGSLYPAYDLDRAVLLYERQEQLAAIKRAKEQEGVQKTINVIVTDAPAASAPKADGFLVPFDDIYRYINSAPRTRPFHSLAIVGPMHYSAALATYLQGRLIQSVTHWHDDDLRARDHEPDELLMLATDPRKLITSIRRYGVFSPCKEGARITLWICSANGSGSASTILWRPQLTLAQRLLQQYGWQLTVAGQPEVASLFRQ